MKIAVALKSITAEVGGPLYVTVFVDAKDHGAIAALHDGSVKAQLYLVADPTPPIVEAPPAQRVAPAGVAEPAPVALSQETHSAMRLAADPQFQSFCIEVAGVAPSAVDDAQRFALAALAKTCAVTKPDEFALPAVAPRLAEVSRKFDAWKMKKGMGHGSAG